VPEVGPAMGAGPLLLIAAAAVGVLPLPLVLVLTFLDTGLSTLTTAGALDQTSFLVRAGQLLGATPAALLLTVLAPGWSAAPPGWTRRDAGDQAGDGDPAGHARLPLRAGAGPLPLSEDPVLPTRTGPAPGRGCPHPDDRGAPTTAGPPGVVAAP
jgi:hypothetical protein